MTTESAPPPSGESNPEISGNSPKKRSRTRALIVVGISVLALAAFGVGLRYYFLPDARLPPVSSLLPFSVEQHPQENKKYDVPDPPAAIPESQNAERKESAPDNAERYADSLEATIKQKDAALYAMRSKRRDAEAEAERFAAERDEVSDLASRIDSAYAFLASDRPKERARYARETSQFSSDVAEVTKRDGATLTDDELRKEFRALYDAENERNAYVLSWSFLPEFMQKYARRWLFVQKIRGNRWEEVDDALEGDDAVRLSTAMRAAQAEGDAEFNAWATKYDAQANMRRAVEIELSKWRAELRERVSMRVTTPN
ncbi:MAG: hypothetical protein ABW189_08755 [Rickettsiales bacterium]